MAERLSLEIARKIRELSQQGLKHKEIARRIKEESGRTIAYSTAWIYANSKQGKTTSDYKAGRLRKRGFSSEAEYE